MIVYRKNETNKPIKTVRMTTVIDRFVGLIFGTTNLDVPVTESDNTTITIVDRDLTNTNSDVGTITTSSITSLTELNLST